MIRVGWNKEVAAKLLDETLAITDVEVKTPAPQVLTSLADVIKANTVQQEKILEQITTKAPEIVTTHKNNLFNVDGRPMNIQMEMQHPRIVMVENVFDKEECEALIELAKERLNRSTVIQANTGGSELSTSRTSDGMFFTRAENNLIATLEKRISFLVRWPELRQEPFQVLRYGVGAEYKPHNDYFNINDPGTESILTRGGNRVGTLLIYLNDVPAGGGTIFPETTVEVRPKRGSAVFFSYESMDHLSRTLHGGSPVVAGEKWVAVKWFRQSTFN
jgi:prolyl 4-hydroxylase